MSVCLCNLCCCLCKSQVFFLLRTITACGCVKFHSHMINCVGCCQRIHNCSVIFFASTLTPHTFHLSHYTHYTGLAVITGVRTNLLLQTEYRISSDVSLDCWVRLKRQKGTGGTEFQPLRKVLTTKQCSTKMRVMQYKKTM